MKKYTPKQLEAKWQSRWKEGSVYGIDISEPSSKKRYILVEFTYPSGDLHIGHWFTFVAPDIYARFSRMRGYTVFLPNGFDAFGLPAENAAIKHNVHPRDWTYSNIERMRRQFAQMGHSYTFEYEVITSDPGYFRWNQWIFLKMYEKGLAYKGQAEANWCPVCQTVLANENVEAGLCWRCHSLVTQKKIEQWFLKITDYADRLIWREDEMTGWPKAVKDAQNNWIGKSEGMEIEFSIFNFRRKEALPHSQFSIKVFTVFPETIFGVTYMVLAPEHPVVRQSEVKEVREYVEKALNKSQKERKSIEKDKTGVFTGLYCINPVNGKKVPIWVADYVIGSYGTGAVMGVPGSDIRDFGFAKTYSLPIIRVIGKSASDTSEIKIEADVLEEGFLVNSEQFNRLKTPQQARGKIIEYLEEKGFGQRSVLYHLHDWSISRQRYWGTPIPIINCPKCGVVPVPEEDLPVELPYNVDYAPKGKPPLATAQDWLNVDCPKCGGKAQRETETMDTFVDSSWYFFRYLDPKNSGQIFDKKLAEKWIPVDIYFGGAEHTLGHTLYSRFFTKFFKDLGLTDLEEYALRRVQHGIVLGPDGEKMSKSRGNVINPDEEAEKYGSDTVRLYLSFMMPYEATGPWDTERVWGPHRFLIRVWQLYERLGDVPPSQEDLRLMNKTIKKVGDDIEGIKLNTAIAALMTWLNHLSRKQEISVLEYKNFLLILAPFAPHITEELWQMMQTAYSLQTTAKTWSVHQQSWPQVSPDYLGEDSINIPVQVNGKLREILKIQKDILNDSSAVEKIALSRPRIQEFSRGKNPKKTIYVPGKIISIIF